MWRTRQNQWKGKKRKCLPFLLAQYSCVIRTSLLGSCALKASVGRVSVDTIGRYGDQHSADISTNTRSICRPRLGRVSVDMNRQACRPTPGRYFTATRPPLGRYFTNTRPTLNSLGQLLLPSSIFPALLREAFNGHRPFLAFNSGNIYVFFPAMFFPRRRFYIRPS